MKMVLRTFATRKFPVKQGLGRNSSPSRHCSCGLRYARSKQKREGIIPQRRKKKDKGPSAKGKKLIKGKRQGGDSASPPPMMTTPPEEKAQPMDLVDPHEYRGMPSSLVVSLDGQC